MRPTTDGEHPHGSTAVELVSRLIQAKLRTIQFAIERMLIKWNGKRGGLPLGGDPNNPLYRLRVLKNQKDSLDPGDMISHLGITITYLKLRDDDGLDGTPPPKPGAEGRKSSSELTVDFRREERDVLVMEVEAEIKLVMHTDETITLQVRPASPELIFTHHAAPRPASSCPPPCRCTASSGSPPPSARSRSSTSR